MSDTSNRRPLGARQSGWAIGFARRLADAKIPPDMISLFSFLFAFVGAGALALSSQLFGAYRIEALFLAAAFIVLRLACNLLDGMVAVEHGKAGPLGPIWNELPDRFSDVVLMIGAGFAASPAGVTIGPALGWTCAVLAVMTAYVRELGRGLGEPSDFTGPMAKPQRMWVLIAAAVFSMTEGLWHGRGEAFLYALALIAVLTLLTIFRRVSRLGRALERKSGDTT